MRQLSHHYSIDAGPHLMAKEFRSIPVLFYKKYRSISLHSHVRLDYILAHHLLFHSCPFSFLAFFYRKEKKIKVGKS